MPRLLTDPVSYLSIRWRWSVQVIYEDLESWCAIRSMFAIPIIMQGKPIKEVQMLSRECGT